MNDEIYKGLLHNSTIRPREIMNVIDFPRSVFKYRNFVDTKSPAKLTFWKESLDGEVYFSLPKEFNSNDPDDCILIFDEEKCKEKILKSYNSNLDSIKKKQKLQNLLEVLVKHFDLSVRDNLKIGCFSTCNPENKHMWGCKEFGGNHTGYCIEYEVDDAHLFSGTTIFLPVSYDENYVDMTNVILDLIDACAKNEEPVNHNLLMSNGYNFCLSKTNSYKDECEWRVIVTRNNWEEYFDIDQKNKKDFSKKIKAIYLGADYEKLERYQDYKDYATKVCIDKNIPLYKMERNLDKLTKIQLY